MSAPRMILSLSRDADKGYEPWREIRTPSPCADHSLEFTALAKESVLREEMVSDSTFLTAGRCVH
jgi:hypothetical protein